MTQAARDLFRLVQLGIITTAKIADTSVQSEVITELKAEVVTGTITEAQYKTYTGTDYNAS